MRKIKRIMRDIRFRAWDKKRKKMVDIHMLLWDYGEPYILEAKGVRDNFYDQQAFIEGGFELMQFTGLKDKNGKEIYCSDIVKGYFDVDKVEGWKWLTLTDKEKKDGWKIFTIDDNLVDFARTHLPDELEIIGNIYENKDLLKGGE